MQDLKCSIADTVTSFGLESLLWNIPNEYFKKYNSLRFTFGILLKYLRANYSEFCNYAEANGIKPLFSSESDIRTYQIFLSQLSEFYQFDIMEN